MNVKPFMPLVAVLALATQAADARPNIVFMLADDQGWDGLSVAMDDRIADSRSDFHQTPNLEKLAASGMRFTRAYAPAPVCSPTRIALQTGLNPAELDWTSAAPPLTAADNPKLIPPPTRRSIRTEETTIAEVLRGAGYATAHFGKWHLGGGGPEKHGYDVSDGDTGNEDAAPFTDPNPVDIFGMTDRADTFMRCCVEAKKPFYLQMSWHALHYPENAMKETIAKYSKLPPGRRHHDIERAAITENLDAGVGKLLESIRKLGIADNTYVVYMSDNGSGGGKRGGISGGKGSLREGGIRVPFIIRGPGIKPGTFCRVPVSGTDLFPTWCKLAGAKAGNVEGGDIVALWHGGNEDPVRKAPGLLFHFPQYQSPDGPSSALIDGRYKALKLYESGKTLLFDLESDPGETRDISAEKPDIARSMTTRLEKRLADAKASLPKPNPSFDPAKAVDWREQRKGGRKNKKNKAK